MTHFSANDPHREPVVSILIKSYNHASYVRQTIESVLEQSFQDFEIVVTDDGSTDDTLSILRSFTDPRIHIEALPFNHGISTAMNLTVARARGRYLAILNSDDWALPDRLKKQVTFLDANPNVSLVFGLPYPVGEANEPTATYNDFNLPLSFPDFSRTTWLRQFLLGGNCLCAPTAMVRREAYEDVGAYDPRFTNLQDFDMWIRMLIAGHNIHLLPDEITAFRIRDRQANMSAPRQDTKLRSSFELSKILKQFCHLNASQFRDIIGEVSADLPASDDEVAHCLALFASKSSRVEYQQFALDYFYDAARQPEDFRLFQTLAGTLDPFNIQRIEYLTESLAVAKTTNDKAFSNLKASLATCEESVAALRKQLQSRDAGFDEMVLRYETTLAELFARHSSLTASPSWQLVTKVSTAMHHRPRTLRVIRRALKLLERSFKP
ncbi:glycosyltransferase [Tardiphaga sp. vice304]|uniref:glycosyltransferase n=1 Tax=Tardiphaga sp. vice304 TaxID=2592817 RepID=UPI00116272B4|nr:glycosyltransferase [Tardiphaga sp. vice304]QDM28153.1 glycosyltransferase [Tardiphaga sp. vice304]